MNIINQVDFINQKVKESYCSHRFVTPLNSEVTRINGFDNPITCDDCGKVLECEHDDVEIEGMAIICITCGADITNYDAGEYYGDR